MRMLVAWMVACALGGVACQSTSIPTDAPSSFAADQGVDPSLLAARAEAAELASADPGQLLATADGFVAAVRRDQDLELILIVQGGDALEMTVLASVPEQRRQAEKENPHTEHFVSCPAALGLANRYYVFGQSVTGQTIVFEGAASTGGTVTEETYVIAISETEVPPTTWRIKTGIGRELRSGSGQVFPAPTDHGGAACAAE